MSFYLSNVVKWNSAYVSVVLLYAIRWRTKCVNECKIAHCAVMCTPFRLCRLPKLQPWEIYYSFSVWAIHKILRNNHIFPFIWMLRNGSEYLLRNVVTVCYKSLEATRSKKALKWCTRHHKSTSFRIFFLLLLLLCFQLSTSSISLSVSLLRTFYGEKASEAGTDRRFGVAGNQWSQTIYIHIHIAFYHCVCQT